MKPTTKKKLQTMQAYALRHPLPSGFPFNFRPGPTYQVVVDQRYRVTIAVDDREWFVFVAQANGWGGASPVARWRPDVRAKVEELIRCALDGVGAGEIAIVVELAGSGLIGSRPLSAAEKVAA